MPLAALDAKLDELAEKSVYVNPDTQQNYSLNAGFCGASSTPTTAEIRSGDDVGYVAAQRICQDVCGSKTAHLCTSNELVRYLATGGTLPTSHDYLWYATGVGWTFTRGDGTKEDAHSCRGYTSASGQEGAAVWGTKLVRPTWSNCSASRPIACCEE